MLWLVIPFGWALSRVEGLDIQEDNDSFLVRTYRGTKKVSYILILTLISLSIFENSMLRIEPKNDDINVDELRKALR